MQKKQTWIVRFFFLFLSGFLLIPVIPSPNSSVCAASVTAENEESLVYIALGDSIATGYGLKGYQTGATPKNSYTSLIKKELEKQYTGKKSVSYYNWATDGRDSSHLLKQLNELSETEKNVLSQAQVITVSIGSNDLLLPFIDMLKEYFQKEPQENSRKGIIELIDTVRKLKKDLIQNEDLLASCEQWNGENGTFHTIIRKLKEMAPNATLYVDTIYNPFDDVKMTYNRFGKEIELFDLGAIADPYISNMNQVFSDTSSDYVLIHLDKEFKAPGLTNVNADWYHFDQLNLDPHPNALGHSVIAECILRKLKR